MLHMSRIRSGVSDVSDSAMDKTTAIGRVPALASPLLVMRQMNAPVTLNVLTVLETTLHFQEIVRCGLKKKRVQEIKVDNGVSFAEARKLVNSHL